MKRDGWTFRACSLLLGFGLLILVPGFIALAQSGAATSSDQNQPASAPVADYRIGPGDVLTVSISDAPDMSGKFRITDRGELFIPGLGAPLPAEGLSAIELAKNIEVALKKAQLLLDPAVNVFVEEYHSRTVTVFGAVNKPSVYPLQKPTTLLEMISMAGGLTSTAGNRVTILHKGAAKAGDTPTGGTNTDVADASRVIDLSDLVEGRDPSLNVQVRDGDVITVSTASVVYVVGAVTKPGGFVIEDQTSGITVLQALARAEGFLPYAARNRSVVFRRPVGNTDSKDPEKIPVDLGKVMEGKLSDVRLQANDILFVPESGAKKNFLTFGRAAINGLVSGVAIYGIGPRIAK